MLKRSVWGVLGLAAVALGAVVSLPVDPLLGERPRGHAFDAFEWWYAQRSAPHEKIPAGAFLRAAEYSRTSMPRERDLENADTSRWVSIGPDNVGGRVLAVAVDPGTPNLLWAGSASGGLWKSSTRGMGPAAWTLVTTGHPTLAVSSIAINPSNPAVIYIGTGEVGSAYGRGQVGTPGARSTYGMGVLKSTDGGATWSITGLAFTFPQVTAVQTVLLNPLNPATLYAATTEGVYRSTDAGFTWSVSLGVLMAMDVVINPQDTSVLYASCGQRNSTPDPGIYRTTNAGASWTLLGGGLPVSDFGRTSLAIAPSSPGTVYASIAHAGTSALLGIYRTTDAGASWTLQTNTNTLRNQGWYDNVIAVHPGSPQTILHGGIDLYKSTNGGSTLAQKSYWAAGYEGVVPAGGPEGPPYYAHADQHAITYDPSDPLLVYFGTDGGVFASTDGGETFEGRNGGFATTQFYAGFAISESNPSVALGGLQDNGTLKYSGAVSWDKTYGGDGGWCAIDPANPDIMYEEYVYLALSKTTNGGASWFGITTGLATGSSNANFIAPFVVAPSAGGVLYAGARVVYKSTNGGGNWFATNGGVLFNGTQVSCIGVSHRSPDTLLAGTGNSGGGLFSIWRSTNGGSSWSNVTGGLPNRFPTDIAFDPSSGTTAYLTFSGYGTPHAFRSTDAGLTWSDISSNLPDIPAQSIAVDPAFPSHLYAGTDLGVYRSTDGGGLWHVFDTGMPPAMILDVGIPSTARIIRAATFGNGIYERGLAVPALFDYRALALLHPAGGAEVIAHSEITGISARVKSVGGIASADSFDVRYRILRGETQLYAASVRTAPLGADESRDVLFPGSCSAGGPGTLSLEALVLAGDENASNDTLRGTMEVVAPGSIASLRVLRQGCPYGEIVGGSPGPSGDDASLAVGLPFPFQFDGYEYDSLQINTNGWAELGAGLRGSERGLSTEAQIGLGNQNGSLFSPSRPTKTLGVWWEDLNTTGGGSITYTTEGTAPARVFVVQWKNMLAYYDPVTTTTRINFQLRLNETGNTAEYRYGPVVPGTFGGADIGAMMGMKDHLGGNYHFYDIALGGTGTAAQGITTLNPLTDWPGPDSCFRIGSDVTSLTVELQEDWNLISVPLARSDNSVGAVYPTAVPGSVFGYDGGYNPADSLRPGSGYWARFPAATTQPVEGAPMPTASISLAQGWNLVGSVDHPVPAPAGGILAGPFYAYTISGYAPVFALQPGMGYWVKASSAGSILLGGGAPGGSPPRAWGDFHRLILRDSRGRTRVLRFGPNSPEAPELPPPAPAGAFDARFGSSIAVDSSRGGRGGFSLGVSVSGAVPPLEVSFLPAPGRGARCILEEREGSRVRASHLLGEGTPVTVERTAGLVLCVEGEEHIPAAFALGRNYPNPFNASTRIEYQMPVPGRATIAVYDLRGALVRLLLGEERPAGRGTIEWDGRTGADGPAGSGVYFVRMEASPLNGGEGFRAVRKILLLK
ncbi:MAG: hypothetical protein WB626_03260 [Bacteroidota bacterium]